MGTIGAVGRDNCGTGASLVVDHTHRKTRNVAANSDPINGECDGAAGTEFDMQRRMTAKSNNSRAAI